MVRTVVLDCSDDLFRGVVVSAVDYGLDHVDDLRGGTAALIVVFYHALALYQQDSECYEKGRVRNGVPGEGEAENVDEDTKHHDPQVVEYLGHGAAQDSALDSFLVLLGGIDPRPEVNEAGGND